MFETQFRSLFKHFFSDFPLDSAKHGLSIKNFVKKHNIPNAKSAAISFLAVYFSCSIPYLCRVALHSIATVFPFALKYRVFEDKLKFKFHPQLGATSKMRIILILIVVQESGYRTRKPLLQSTLQSYLCQKNHRPLRHPRHLKTPWLN